MLRKTCVRSLSGRQQIDTPLLFRRSVLSWDHFGNVRKKTWRCRGNLTVPICKRDYTVSGEYPTLKENHDETSLRSCIVNNFVRFDRLSRRARPTAGDGKETDHSGTGFFRWTGPSASDSKATNHPGTGIIGWTGSTARTDEVNFLANALAALVSKSRDRCGNLLPA
jgi:hypothetical protein